jgi:hypothetical protein
MTLEQLTKDGWINTGTFGMTMLMLQRGKERILYDEKSNEIISRYNSKVMGYDSQREPYSEHDCITYEEDRQSRRGK